MKGFGFLIFVEKEISLSCGQNSHSLWWHHMRHTYRSVYIHGPKLARISKRSLKFSGSFPYDTFLYIYIFGIQFDDADRDFLLRRLGPGSFQLSDWWEGAAWGQIFILDVKITKSETPIWTRLAFFLNITKQDTWGVLVFFFYFYFLNFSRLCYRWCLQLCSVYVHSYGSEDV